MAFVNSKAEPENAAAQNLSNKAYLVVNIQAHTNRSTKFRISNAQFALSHR
jgi:hypothetical protein